MDATLVIVLIVIALPVLVIWALSKSAGMRGPAPPAPQSRKPVEMLVTDAVPEEHPDDEDYERPA
jgi:heme/copper-type cytochrome/quinol oxidase subunit 2